MKIPISEKLYQKLENYASEVSKKIHRKVSIDEIANVGLRYGLNNPEIIQKALEKWRQKRMENIRISFKRGEDKKGKTAFYILTSNPSGTEYIGNIRWIGSQKIVFKRIFNLTEEQAESLLWKTVNRFYRWAKKLKTNAETNNV